MTHLAGTYSFSYDIVRPLTGTTIGYSFLSRTLTNKYSYDAASNRIAFTNPEAGITSYTYDSLNRLTALRDFNANAFTFSYDALGQRTSLNRPNLVNTSYTYDANGNTLTKTDSTGATSYSWDFENRLTGVRLANGSVANFRYDPFGRRILRSSPATPRVFVYDSDNVQELSTSLSSNQQP